MYIIFKQPFEKTTHKMGQTFLIALGWTVANKF